MFKQMDYKTTRNCEILHSGEYGNHRFNIISLGTHPVAYVECKLPINDYDDNLVRDIDVHGGFTYFGLAYWDKEDTTTLWLGWDYSHYGDFSGYYLNPEFKFTFGLEEKHWTTQEIYDEVICVINQLNSIVC